MDQTTADRGEMPFYVPDGDKADDYRKPVNFDFEKEARKHDGGVLKWAKRNWLRLAISTVIILFILLILSVVLYFCLRTLPKKHSCRKLFEIEIVSMAQYEFRIRWAPEHYADVEAKYFLQDLVDGTRISKRETCNCSALISFWQWWSKNYDHLNPLLKKFELAKNPVCSMVINAEFHQNLEQLKACTAVVLKFILHGDVKELAFLAGDAGFLTVTATKKPPRRALFKYIEADDVTKYLFNENDDVHSKIEEFFKAAEEEDAKRLTLYYSKPLTYIKELAHEHSSRTKEMSHFTPYSETGYYVSLPRLVYLEKISNIFLRAAKQLIASADLIVLDTNNDELKIQNYFEAVRGITNPNVANYYMNVLKDGLEKSQSLIISALKKLSVSDTIETDYATCSTALSECFAAVHWKKFILTIYNPSNHPISSYIKLPVSWGEYSIQTPDGLQVPSEIKRVPLSICKAIVKENKTEWELVFRAENIAGFGFKSYYVSRVVSSNNMAPSEEKIELILDAAKQEWWGVKTGGAEYFLTSEVSAYESNFCGGTLNRFNIHGKAVELSMPLHRGNLVMEFETFYDKLGSRIIRSFAGENYLEVEWIFENFTDEFEIVTQYIADIDNLGVFHIDGLGKGSQEKKSKKGECSQDCIKNGTCFSRTYYPVQEISITDSFTQLIIVSELPQSGTSACSGTIEFSVLMKSHNSTENQIMREKHWIFIGEAEDENLKDRAHRFAQEKKSDPLLFFMKAENISFEDWSQNFITEFSGLSETVPDDLLILTFEPRDKNTTWTRLKNTGSDPLTIALQDIFPQDFEATEIPFGSSRCLPKFKTASQTLCNENFEFQFNHGIGLNADSLIEFFPSEIKSFILKKI